MGRGKVERVGRAWQSYRLLAAFLLMPRILGPNLRKSSGIGMKRTVMRARMRPAKRGLRAVYI